MSAVTEYAADLLEWMCDMSTERGAEPALEITRRRLPHWILPGSIYFITFRLAEGELTEQERSIVLQQIRSGDAHYYRLIAAVIMPDHVHLLLQPLGDTSLSRIMKGIKGCSARELNRFRGTRGQVWVGESWDRIIRDQKELVDKIDYMLHNPLKRGLTDDPMKYDGWYWNGETE